MLKNLKLKYKLGLLSLIPFVGLLIFAYDAISPLLNKSSEITRLSKMVNLAGSISRLVHESQKERGLTSAYLGSRGGKLGSELDSQRATTTQRLQDLKQVIAAFDPEKQSDRFLDSIKAAQNQLEKLENHRGRVKPYTGNFAAQDGIGYYSELNARLLNIVKEIGNISVDKEVSFLVLAYLNFQQGKERAGIERAFMSSVFARGTFKSGQLARFASLIAEQNTFLQAYELSASPEALAFSQKTLKSPMIAEVQKMRKIALDNASSGDFGIQVEDWFAKATSRINLLKQVDDYLAGEIAKYSNDLKSDAALALSVRLAELAGILVVNIVAIVLIFRTLLGSIRQAINSVNRLSEGYLNIERVEAGEDEIGQMQRSTGAMVENLSRIVGNVGRSTDKLNYASEGLATTASQIAASSEEAQSQTTRVAAASEEISASVNTVAAAAEQASVNMSSITDTVGELSDNLNTVAAAAEQANANMQGIGKNVENISVDVSKVADGIEKNSNALNEVSETTRKGREISTTAQKNVESNREMMEKLGEAAQQIGKVVNLINNIASQTNMLALNATIEAASAGETGKGFAVVASEVKDLAQQTSTSSDEIGRQIDEIQKYTDTVRKNMGDVSGVIQEVVDLNILIDKSIGEQKENASNLTRLSESVTQAASESNDSVKEALAGLREISRSYNDASNGAKETVINAREAALGVKEIARSTSEAAAGVKETNQNLQVTQNSIKEVNLGIQEVHKNAESLAAMSADVKETMTFFKTAG